MLVTVTSKVKNKKAGCLPDSLGILATMYVNDKCKEKHKEAGIRKKKRQDCNYILIYIYIYIYFIFFVYSFYLEKLCVIPFS